MEKIDLRSDTVTKPSEAMRRAMAAAEVGDDVYREDPTVNRLEETAAAMFDKEAAMLVPSGTMANQIAIMTHTRHGDNVIVGVKAHLCHFESGGGGALSGVQFTQIGDGLFKARDLDDAITLPDQHFAPTTLICIENTHNYSGGRIFPYDDIVEISAMARFWGLRLHLDGARIYNASVATGIDVREYAKLFDSNSFCLSKGLGCPIGSILLGDKDFIKRARRYRKMLGGGMRQAGIIAAAGLYALEHNIERLKEDHDNARSLAKSLNAVPGFKIDMSTVQSNIVNVEIEDSAINAHEFVFKAANEGVSISNRGTTRFRMVTHLDFKSETIAPAVERLARTLDKMKEEHS